LWQPHLCYIYLGLVARPLMMILLPRLWMDLKASTHILLVCTTSMVRCSLKSLPTHTGQGRSSAEPQLPAHRKTRSSFPCHPFNLNNPFLCLNQSVFSCRTSEPDWEASNTQAFVAPHPVDMGDLAFMGRIICSCYLGHVLLGTLKRAQDNMFLLSWAR
jgi:hypothetical protein